MQALNEFPVILLGPGTGQSVCRLNGQLHIIDVQRRIFPFSIMVELAAMFNGRPVKSGGDSIGTIRQAHWSNEKRSLRGTLYVSGLQWLNEFQQRPPDNGRLFLDLTTEARPLRLDGRPGVYSLIERVTAVNGLNLVDMGAAVGQLVK